MADGAGAHFIDGEVYISIAKVVFNNKPSMLIIRISDLKRPVLINIFAQMKIFINK